MAEQSNAPAKTSRKQQAEQTKQKLLTVAMELIREQGFDNVKIEDICRAAGVSTGAFYHHLKSKAGIVVESYSQCDAYFNETVYPSLANDCTVNAVLQYIAFQMQYATDFGVDIILQIYKAQLTEGTDFFLSPERGLPLGLTRILAHLQQQGVIRSEKPAEEICREILVISRGVLYNWCQCKGNYDLKAFALELVSNYLKSYTV